MVINEISQYGNSKKRRREIGFESALPTMTGIEESLSPEKIARISMLRLRFADTIFKAQQTLFHGKDCTKTVPRSLETKKLGTQEKKVLGVKKHRQPKANAQSEIKRLKEINDRKRRQEIESQRKTARIAIEKITRTVSLDNLSVLDELETLMGCPCVYNQDWFQ